MTFNIKDFWLIVLVVCAILHLSNSRLSMEWSIKIKMDQVNGDMDQIAHKIGQEIGLETKGQIGALLGHYLFEIKNNSNHEAIETILSQHSLIEWHKKEKHLHRVKKRPLQKVESVSHAQQNLVNFKDPLFSRQWHLRNGIFGNKDCNVIDVWMNDITGRGVVIAIVDDGVEWHHPDLSDNYCPEGSIDLNDNDRDPTPSLDQSEQNMHGTRCAGEVAAVPNSVCGVGIAFGSKFSAIKLLDGPTTDAMEATAFTKYLDINDIYSCSWGPEDDGKSIDGPHKHGDLALKHGVIAGRNGFGSIYVVASGNGGDKHDNCNFDGYASSIYTITIGAIDEAGQIPPYSEECTSMFACTVSSGKYPSRRIVTTDWSLPDANSEDQCTDDHSGTSAATPLASGMIALMLEVRPCMTWRDIQHIITMTAMDVNHSTAWTNNQAGFRHSNFHGFGLLDSWKLVNAAKIWRSVPWLTSFVPDTSSDKNVEIPCCKKQHLEVSVFVSKADCAKHMISTLEHVAFSVDVVHTQRGKLKFSLLCPSRTESVIPTRKNDESDVGLKWSFSSVKCWGENPFGLYVLVITDTRDVPDKIGFLKSWQLTIYGSQFSSEEAGKRRKLINLSVDGRYLNNYSIDCPKAGHPYFDVTSAISENTIKLVTLLSCFLGFWAIYYTFEIACCGPEKYKTGEESSATNANGVVQSFDSDMT